MRVNIDWLRDWVDLEGDAEGVAADLTTSGLEVDAIEPLAGATPGIVVAEVLRVDRHPNADRLSVCLVDDGAGQHQVVCGAANVAAGIKAPFARVGAKLPGGKAIGAAELRGVQSNGMLCSAKELELVDDVNGLLILDADARKGTAIAEYLRLDDAVLEINVTANRGDCFSVIGIGRELAARRGARLARRQPAAQPQATMTDVFPIALDNAGPGCPRFAGRVLRGLATNARTPLWMRERLRRAGVRPIQPIVDVTNYVMLELGQPLHAYDLAKLDRRIEARLARANESLTLLDGRAVALADDMLVIADARGPVGLAGIMGGKSTAVSDATDSVFLESAFFAPAAISGRARRIGLHTDASLRFERGVDPTGQARAIERATELLLTICGGQAGPISRGRTHRRSSAAARRHPTARAAARRARRRGTDARGCRHFFAFGDASGEQARRLARDAAALPFRHRDRRRLDRRGRPHVRLRRDSRDAGRGRRAARSCRRARGRERPRRRSAGRARVCRGNHLQLHRSGPGGTGEPRCRARRAGESHRERHGRAAALPVAGTHQRGTSQRQRTNGSACGCSRSARNSRLQGRGLPKPPSSPAWRSARAPPSTGTGLAPKSTTTTSKATSRRCCG